MIRPFTPDDAGEMATLSRANREFLAPFEPDRPEAYYTEQGQRERIEEALEWAATDRGWRFAVVDDGVIVGTIGLTDVIRGPVQLANVGYWIDRQHNGRGLASQAVSEIVEFAFGDAGLHRLEAGTLPDNHASQHVLEKNGFVRYGFARGLLLIAGEWRDHVLFERLAD